MAKPGYSCAIEGGGRSAEERRAAADARQRAREGWDPEGEPPGSGEGTGSAAGGRGPRMSRYYGGADVYGRRRLVAGVCILIVVLVLFAMLGGC